MRGRRKGNKAACWWVYLTITSPIYLSRVSITKLSQSSDHVLARIRRKLCFLRYDVHDLPCAEVALLFLKSLVSNLVEFRSCGWGKREGGEVRGRID